MGIKDVLISGTEKLSNSIQQIAENEKVGAALQKAMDVVTDVSLETYKAASKAANTTYEKTVNYVNENRLAPGAKEQYIKELERTIKEKDQEIARLKRRLSKKNWKKGR